MMMTDDTALPLMEQKGNYTEGRPARTRELNDLLRKQGRGGIIQMTNGIAALGLEKVNLIFAAIAAFDDFGEDNDPWGEHDCSVMMIEGIKVIWKVDYYDRSRTYLSPDPSDPKVTVRVMTVMRADEY
jgi:hypothetical protein